MNPQDKNLDREGGEKCTYPRCACDSKSACTVPQAGAAVAIEPTPEICKAMIAAADKRDVAMDSNDARVIYKAALASQPQAGAAVPSEQDKRLAIAAAKNESLSVHARVMAAINARQSKAARWFYSNAPEEHVRELVSWVLSITSASGAGEVKPWRERLTPEGEDEYDLADQHTAAETAMMAEIADLRAQLASLNGQLAQCVAESAKWAAAAGAANAQLARLQAPVGESIDTLAQEINAELTSTQLNIGNLQTLLRRAADQLARQRKDWQTVQGMADCMDMVRQELIEAGVIDKSVPPMMVANAVVQHIARQRKGEPVAWHGDPIIPADWCLVPKFVTDDILAAAGHIEPRQYEAMCQAAGEWYEQMESEGRIKFHPSVVAAAFTTPPSAQQEPVAYADPMAFINFKAARETGKHGGHSSREWMWANPATGLVPLYTGPVAAQQEQGDAVRDALLFAADTIELFDDTTMQANYMLDAGECANIIRALPDYLALRATKTEGEEQQ